MTFDKNDNEWSCNNYPQLPVSKLGGATGGMLNDGTVIVCGGSQGYLYMFEDKCYILKPGTTVIETRKMTTQRYLASSVVINGKKLFITGGYIRNQKYIVPFLEQKFLLI